jgi:hypothetical protein
MEEKLIFCSILFFGIHHLQLNVLVSHEIFSGEELIFFIAESKQHK